MWNVKYIIYILVVPQGIEPHLSGPKPDVITDIREDKIIGTLEGIPTDGLIPYHTTIREL